MMCREVVVLVALIVGLFVVDVVGDQKTGLSFFFLVFSNFFFPLVSFFYTFGLMTNILNLYVFLSISLFNFKANLSHSFFFSIASNNEFSGTIPTEIGNWTKVEYLFVFLDLNLSFLLFRLFLILTLLVFL